MNWNSLLRSQQAKDEADRIEQLQEEREQMKRAAYEEFLITARAHQHSYDQEALRTAANERQAWDLTILQIQLIYYGS
jgi:single-stranded DNA-specific DHH superfamily exonuclease